MVLWPLLAALGRCGACVGSSWSLLGLSWRSLGPLSATLGVVSNIQQRKDVIAKLTALSEKQSLLHDTTVGLYSILACDAKRAWPVWL